MKILLFGKNGQLGSELVETLAPLGELIALDRSGVGELCGDLQDLNGIAKTIQSVRPDIVINAAAYTAVDKAESEQELVNLVNAKAPELMAAESAKLGSWLIHYSTDYVFDGSGRDFWKETDEAQPLNQYGHSKRVGELAIEASNCSYLIFRTSWVYGKTGNNFLKTILGLAKRKDRLQVVDDQYGVPAGAKFLAETTAEIISKLGSVVNPSGIYHLVPRGETSWHGYASYLVDQARQFGENLVVEKIDPVESSAFPVEAKRPANSRLDTSKVERVFSIKLPDWRQGVSDLVAQLCRDETKMGAQNEPA